ncbi:hypothetical protein [Dyella psychrodurans]|nr:hypothetical protein [Dyella psychrodurans]
MSSVGTLIFSRFASQFFFWTGFLLVACGFLFLRTWVSIPYLATGFLIGLALVSLVFACGLRFLLKCRLATGLAMCWIFALACFVGIAALISVLLIALAAMGIGSLVVSTTYKIPAPLTVLVGLAFIAGIAGWLLPFPIHTRATYILVLIGISLYRWPAIVATIRPLLRSWTGAVDGAPWMASVAVTTIGVVSTCAWIPTIHFDDLAYHLGLPYQLETLSYYRMDAGSQLWAVAPWAGDVIQGIAQLVAGAEARGAVDVLWLMLTTVMLWKLGEALELGPSSRWLIVALYASAPLTADTLTGMQTEGPTAAVVVALAWLIQRTTLPDRRCMLGAALLFGLLIGLKTSNFLAAGPLALWLLWRWRGHLPWRMAFTATLLALAVAGSSYSFGYLLTGNPVLPLFNGHFHSPYYLSVNFRDTTYQTGLHAYTLWDLIFHTSHFSEGFDGSIGFTPLALLGSMLIAITAPRARPLALVAIAAFVLPLVEIQYVRYTQPAIALLTPVMLCGAPPMVRKQRGATSVSVAFFLLILVNLAFVANGSWQLRDGVLADLLVHGRAFVISTYAPIRQLADIIRRNYGSSARTLLVDRRYPYAAELAGTAFVTSWYDNELVRLAWKANDDPQGEQWLRVFDRTGANLAIVHKDDHRPALDAALEKSHGVAISSVGDFELWTLHREHVGTAAPASPHVVIAKIDSLPLPTNTILLNATLELRCAVTGVPIVIGWYVVQEGDLPWANYESILCGPSGLADASLETSKPSKAIGLTITAVPSHSGDPHLSLVHATASARNDLMAERDLAAQWRGHFMDWIRR